MEKRISCRAVIFDNQDNLLTMYREKKGKIYYTFAGGGLETDETKEACVVREVKEEFGIDVEVVKLLYVIDSLDSTQYFFLCRWIAGEFGTGEGEEFHENYKYGLYLPKLVPLENLKSTDLKPPEIVNALINDLEKFGKELNNEVLSIKIDYANMGWEELTNKQKD